MKRLLIFFAFLLAWSVTAFAQRGLKPQDLYQLQSVGEAQMSPDGTHIIYTVVHSDRPGAPYSVAWLMDVETGKSSRLGGESGSASGSRWSPDGKSIAYVGSVDDKSGLVVAK